jgi:hypothetical protein
MQGIIFLGINVQNAHNLILFLSLLLPHADHICPSPRQPGVRRRAQGKSPSRRVGRRRPWLRPSCHGSSTCRWHPPTRQSLPLAWAPSATTGERAPADASVVAAGLGSIRRAMGVPPTVGLGLSCHPGPVLEGGERGGRPRPPNQEGPFTGIYKQYSIQNIRAQV